MKRDPKPQASIPIYVCVHGTLHSRRDLEDVMPLLTKHPEKFPDGVCIYRVLHAATV